MSARDDGRTLRVLVVGGGAREHALVEAIAASPLVREVVAMPGNAGIAAIARCLPGKADDVAAIVEASQREAIDFVVIGPEAPLVAGVVDALTAAGVLVFGPSKAAAQLEGSKAFCKELMRRNAIATSDFAVFDDAEAAKQHVRAIGRPLVVKADGLAAGKGVVVADTIDETCAAIDSMLVDRAFGDAGARVVLEDRVRGVEVSFHALCDGERFVALAAAQDHKRVGEGDTGPNTGGMGAVSPPADVYLTPYLHERILREVIAPAVAGMRAEGAPFRGVLFAGLMIGEAASESEQPPIHVLEFNVRFGDPETAVLLARLDEDLVPWLLACARGDLRACPGPTPAVSRDPALAVVIAAEGYPGRVTNGDVIAGLDDAAKIDGVRVLHAGTRLETSSIVSTGGRVLCVTARGRNVDEAADRAYAAIDKIRLRGSHYRRDIAARTRRQWSDRR